MTVPHGILGKTRLGKPRRMNINQALGCPSEQRRAKRLNEVVNLLHLHCDKELNLDTLANKACLSRFHFSRTFLKHLGDTPIHFLQRIRVERAARKLTYCPNESITQIALACGYSSSQTLARSFRHRFGCTPREHRQQRGLGSGENWSATAITQAFNESADLVRHLPARPGNFPNVNIVSRPQMPVAYVRHYGAYGNRGNAAGAFARLRQCVAGEVSGHLPAYMGVSWDNRSVTPDAFCRYDACVAMSHVKPLDSRLCLQTLPGGTYASTRMIVANHDLPTLWDCLMLAFKNAGLSETYQIVFGPQLEQFSIDQSSGVQLVTFYVPVVSCSKTRRR